MNSNYATQPNLDTKKPVGGNGIDAPVYKNGVATLATVMSADTKDSSTNMNQTASSENRSAKFKNPNVKQNIPSAGQGQYQ
jgi:hypothetical protein